MDLVLQIIEVDDHLVVINKAGEMVVPPICAHDDELKDLLVEGNDNQVTAKVLSDLAEAFKLQATRLSADRN